MDGNNLIYVDHGDAYPRTVVMHGNVLKKKEYNIFYSGYTQPLYYNGSIIWIDSMGYVDGNYWEWDTVYTAEQSQFTRIYLD
jgi:hypothetical protein